MAAEHEPLLRDLYAAFNARDVDAVLGHLHADVDWPNAFEGGRVAVAVHQLVRALDGTVIADREVTHVYSFRDGLIERMDVIEPAE